MLQVQSIYSYNTYNFLSAFFLRLINDIFKELQYWVVENKGIFQIFPVFVESCVNIIFHHEVMDLKNMFEIYTYFMMNNVKCQAILPEQWLFLLIFLNVFNLETLSHLFI